MAVKKNQENVGILKKLPVSNKVCTFGSNVKKIGEEDPRKLVHSIKVGLAIALVSLFYYFEPLFNYEGFGVSSMWAVLTVVVVFEFSVGKFLLFEYILVLINYSYGHRMF